jgi:hypothetical protein
VVAAACPIRFQNGAVQTLTGFTALVLFGRQFKVFALPCLLGDFGANVEFTASFG